MAASTIAKLFVELGFKDKDLQRGLRGAERGLTRLNSSINRMNTALGGAASKAFYTLTGSVTAFMTASAVVGARFDREMTFVGAISNATADDLQALTDKARELGATTMFTATQSATAMQNFARAGMDVNEILDSTGPALKLAGAAGEDMSLSTQTLAATMAQFSSMGYEAGTVADVFATALTGSLFDLRSLTEAMKYGGTVGANFGMSLEETTAALAQFRNLGLEGSLAGTNFRMAMAHAAKATDKAQKVLAKYNLTAKDINPELHSFGEIMTTVGEASMTTTDLLEVFGRRAGANIAGISKQFADGSTEFYELLGDIEGSAGAVENLYNESTANVLDQFKIVSSAFQELLLTTFDQYRDPAMVLLNDITRAINDVTNQVNADSATIQSSVDELFAYLRSIFIFAEGEAGSVVSGLIKGFMDVLIVLQMLLPMLDEIFKIMVGLFVVGKVVAFTNAIVQLTTAISGLGTAFTAVRTAMLAMMGPGGWAIAGVGLLIAGVGSLTAMWNNNKAAIEANKKATEDLIAKQKAAEEARNRAISAGVSATNQWAGSTLLRLEAEGEVDRVYKRELEKLMQMGDQEIQRGIAAGQIIETMEDGETVYKTINLLVHDTAQGMISEFESQEQINSAVQEMNRQLTAATAEKLRFQGFLNDTRETFKLTHNDQIDGLSNVNAAQLEVMKRSRGITGSWRSWVTTAHGAQDEVERLSGIIENLGLVQERATINAQRFEQALMRAEGTASDLGDTENENADERQKRLDEYLKALEAARDARIKAHEEVDKRLQESLATEADLVEMRYNEDRMALMEAFYAELELVKNNNKKKQELQETFDAALAALEQAALNERYNAMRDIVVAQTEERQNAVERTELEALDRIHQKQRLEILQEAQFALRIAGETVEERQAIIERSNEQLAVLEASQAKARSQLEKDISGRTAEAIAEIRKSNLGPLHTKIMQLELDLENALTAAVDASEKQKQQIRDLFAARRRQLVVDSENEILVLLGRVNQDVLKLEEEKAVMLANLTEETEKYRSDIILHYDALIKQARAEGGDDPLLDDLTKLEKFILKMEKISVASFKEMVKQIGFIGVEMRDQIPAVNAASMAIGKVVGPVEKAVGKVGLVFKGIGAAAIVGMKNAHDAVKDTEVQAVTPLGQTVEAMGTGFYQLGVVGVQAAKGLAAGYAMLGGVLIKVGKAAFAVGGAIMDVASKMADMFGRALDGLAALTGFSFSLVDTVSQVNDLMGQRAELEAQLAAGGLSEEEAERIRAELAAMPANASEAATQAITKMVEDAVQMVTVFAEAAPVILQELAMQIPVLLDAVATQLPIIIEALATYIPVIFFQIVESIPVLVQALVESLPTLFEAIFALLPTLITALMDAVVQLLPAVGQIVASFIEQIPNIVFAFLDALPELIVAIIDQLQVIIAAFVEMIPMLIFAIAEALPDILVTLIDMTMQLLVFLLEQIPMLIQGVLEALPTLINAILSSIPRMIQRLVAALPAVITALVNAIPTIITAIIAAIPEIITAIIANLPAIIFEVIKAMPQIALALVVAVVRLLFIEIPKMAWLFIQNIGQFFSDVIREIVTAGIAKTETFGDTPGMQYAGEGPRRATFAAGDYFAAATTPMGVLRQAVEAVRGTGAGTAALSQLSGVPAISPGSLQIPGLMGLSGTMMSMVDAMGGGGGGGQQPLKVVVTAEGETLDSVMFTAQRRGHMPELTRDFSRASGVSVGFDRGKFQFNS